MRTAAVAVRLALLTAAATAAPAAHAFCGFYVGKADTQLFNQASQVALVRDGDRTVLTMSNDYRGELKDFALVVPVPTVLERDQIHVNERKYIERLDAYSAPRLVEYHDPNPCQRMVYKDMAPSAAPRAAMKAEEGGRAWEKSLGVTVEAQYTIGEYDIVLLSAKESSGLKTWLLESGYKIPKKADAALDPYVKQNMKFFVAKVNLKEQKAGGFSYLRPLQIAYESPKFMLPIRLGMANADGPQDLVIYTLTRKGRVESTNYKTTKVPTGMDLPVFVKSEFGPFYKATFEQQYRNEQKRALFTEYVWDMGWCDPCAANPLTPEELGELGVFWLDEGQQGGGGPRPMGRGGAVSNVILTRLHVRYDHEHFPEDLVFQETGDRQNFQARYVLRHAFKGDLSCPGGDEYKRQLDERHGREVETLASLTGWERASIIQKMGDDAPGSGKPQGPWFKKIWKK